MAAPVWIGLLLLPRCDVDLDAVLRRTGLSRSAFTEPGARVPALWEHELWRAIEAEAGDSAIGLRIAALYVRDGLPSLEGYLSRNAATLRATLLMLERFARLADDRMSLPLLESGEQATLRIMREAAADRAPGFVECMFAAMIGFTQRYVDATPPLSVHLQRKRPRTTSAYRAAYGVEPCFGASHSQITFPRSLLDLPVRGADPMLGTILESHAARLVEDMPDEDPFVQRVRALLVDELGKSRSERAHITAKLALSERTIRRRLQARQIRYKDLLDEVRCDVACKLLAEGEPIAAIAEQLGYHGPGALQRAFMRWKQLTPSQYRRSLGPV